MKVYVLMEQVEAHDSLETIRGVFATLKGAAATITPGAVPWPFMGLEGTTGDGPWGWGSYCIEEHEVQE